MMLEQGNEVVGAAEAGHELLRLVNGVLQMPDGGTIRALAPPPRGFDPLAASEDELLAHGFPCRPDEAERLDLWKQAVGCRRIEPVFRRVESPAPEPAMRFSSTRTSGVVTPPGGNLMRDVTANWVVPNVYPPVGAVDGVWYSASTWVGFVEPSFFKAGVQGRVVSTFGSTARQFLPFWEWETWGLFQVVSLAVSPGDLVWCTAVLNNSGGSTATAATITLSNVSSGLGISFTVTPGKGALPTTYTNWVVEALKINSADVALARFGMVYFDSALSHNSLGSSFRAGDGDIIDMTSGGHQVAYGGILNPYLVSTRYGANPF